MPLSTTTDSKLQLANSTRREVYTFIEKELTESIPFLATDKSKSYGRLNKHTANTLLAKLYLNAEAYKGEAEWAKAAAACKAVIDSGGYKLESDYFANFATENTSSQENIFAIPFDEIKAPGFRWHMITLHYENYKTYDFKFSDGPWNGFTTLAEFYNSYDNADKRKRGWIVGQQFSSKGDTLKDSGKNLIFTPEINSLTDADRMSGVRQGKFQFKTGAIRTLDNDFPIYRYADVLLMRAEALWRQNPADAEALTLINRVRSRAGLPALAAITADAILAERGHELAWECTRRTDLIRFGKFASPYGFKGTDIKDRSVFPIPARQITANPKLTQNDGYN